MLREFVGLQAAGSLRQGRRAMQFCVLAALACASPTPRPLVPQSAPDYRPNWITDSLNWVENPSQISSKFVRDVVIVRFVEGATQRQRQAAVDAVGGKVIGGAPFSGIEGMYYIGLPTDSTNERVFRAIGKLSTLPQIANALPDIVLDDVFGLPLRSAVPVVPPDSVPISLYDPKNLTELNGPGEWFMRDIVLVRFAPSATQAERQKAIDVVHGVVVGGRRWEGGDGLYLIKVPSDTANKRLGAAVAVLNKAVGVRWAMPNVVWTGP